MLLYLNNTTKWEERMKEKIEHFKMLYRAHKEDGTDETLMAMTDYLNENDDLRIAYNKLMYNIIGRGEYETIIKKRS